MLSLKYVYVLLTISLLAMVGFLGISSIDNSVLQQDSSNLSYPTSIINDELPLSEQFLQYEYLLNHTDISKTSIESELDKLNSGFEKDYLSGLLNKRKGKFNAAYNNLAKHLDSFPKLFRYYNDLVNLANITNNLTALSTRLSETSEPNNKYYNYLIGMVELTKGNYTKAIDNFNSLVVSGQASKEVYYNLATAYRGIGDYQNGLKELTEAESLIDTNSFYYPKIINAKGSLFYLSDEYDLAEQYYQSAYNHAIVRRNVVEEIKALTNLAIIKDLYGDTYSARDFFNKALLIAEKIENHNLIALLHSELGVSFTYTNNIVEARKNYEKSYGVYSLLKNNERLSYLSSNIASIYLQQTNYKSALKYYNEGLKFAGSNILGKILNITGIADVYSNESNYAQALKYYKLAEQLADSIKDVSSLITVKEGLGALYYNINRPYKSLKLLESAMDKINMDDMPFDAVELIYKIGTVLASVDSFELAKNFFAKGIKITEKTGDIYYDIILNTELAHTYYKLDEINLAKTTIFSAKDKAEEYQLSQLVGLQELYLGKFFEAEGNKNSAEKYYETSFSVSKSAGDYNTQIEAGFRLAKILEKKSELDLAEKWYLETINVIEKISFPLVLNQEIQIAHFSGVNEVFNSLVEFYIRQNKTTEAFEVIEKSRSRNTMLNIDKLKLLSSVEDEEKFVKYIDLEWMISSGLYSDIVVDSLKEISKSLEEYFKKGDKDLEYYLSKRSGLSVEDIQSNLSKDENLISVYVGSNFIQLFLLTNENISTLNVDISRDSLISLLEKIAPLYRSDLAKEDIYINQDLFSFNAEASWQLYKVLFKKLFDDLPNKATIIFSFPSELLLMPAEFLVTEWTDGESPYYYKDKNFLINKYPVLYSPSASIYITQKKKEQIGNKQNLLVGNPYIDNDEFTISYRSGLLEDNDFSTRNISLFPLEYSETEIENINDLVSNGIVFLSENATETNFKLNASNSSIIHLSTHSLLYKNQPLIIFSQQEDETDDGYLEVGEILQLNLNSDLVVLSSCRSGLGDIDEAEGILGMQKAFFEAGASSIVVSLWDVNDKYTSYFMKEFYEQLSKGLNKPDALRNAKLNFIKEYSANPYYWSAFVLSGNPSEMKIQKASSPLVLQVLLIILFAAIVFSVIYSRRRS
jgi:CHAT domain-containing protein/tetratricopeptide (TPR) repeat protein